MIFSLHRFQPLNLGVLVNRSTTALLPLGPHALTMEVLLMGKAQYSWPPCTNKLILIAFYNENIFTFLQNKRYLNEEVNCIEPSPQVSIPCTNWYFWRMVHF